MGGGGGGAQKKSQKKKKNSGFRIYRKFKPQTTIG